MLDSWPVISSHDMNVTVAKWQMNVLINASYGFHVICLFDRPHSLAELVSCGVHSTHGNDEHHLKKDTKVGGKESAFSCLVLFS